MMNEEPRRVCQPRDTSVMRLTKVGKVFRWGCWDGWTRRSQRRSRWGRRIPDHAYKRKELAGVGLEIFETLNTNPAAAEFDDVAALEIVEDGGCGLPRSAD